MDTPFIPRTAAKLTLGDYCSLGRDDGRFVPLVFLAKVLNKRVVFYGALLAMVSETPVVAEDGSMIELAEVAMIDIDVFSEHNAPIRGNLSRRLSKKDVEARLLEMKTHSSVWGRRTPIKYANKLDV